MELLGFLSAIIIGISLGLIGGGGSILTLPVLVYLFGVGEVAATAYSLFIVGTSSLVGVIPKYKNGLVHLKTAIIFGIPAIVAVFSTRKYIVPAIPETVFTVGDFIFTKALMMMILFAILMVVASFSMIRKKTVIITEDEQEQKFNYPMILIEGSLVGILTGIVGAGGGFLIIPALVFLSKLPMKMAVGTSLMIIAAKSLIGFLGDLSVQVKSNSVDHLKIDWNLLLTFTLLAIVGIFIGNFLSKKIDGDKLKVGFGWFVLVMGVYIIISELLK